MRAVSIIGFFIGVLALVVVLMEVVKQRKFRKEVRASIKKDVAEKEIVLSGYPR